MTINIVIGIGGTGAKVVESVLHLTSAGLLPEQLYVGLVDQDRSNGNVNRTERLVQTLINARRAWREGTGHHTLGSSPLFRSEIRKVSESENVWTPHPNANVTLAQIFDRESMDETEQRLFDSLFAVGKGAGDTEQRMPLDQGYRGRPHIGAAAMTSRIETDVDFWKQLVEHVNSARGSRDVNILLVGSVFGGTGAAGFPTLAKLIRRKIPEGAENVRIGGVLMLPYFDFAAPPSDEVDSADANVARAEELAQQSQNALKYYADMLAREPVFDQLYMVGWDQPFSVGDHHAGAQAQENPPLLPEVFAGLAAARFFEDRQDRADGSEVYTVARADADAVNWTDLPSPFGDNHVPLKSLGRLLRFGASWKYWSPIVSRPRSGLSRMITRDPWYRMQQVNSIDFRAAAPENEVAALNQYVDDLLRWAAAIEVHANAAKLDFRLWRLEEITQRDGNGSNRFRLPVVLNEQQHDALLNRLIVPGESTGSLPTSADLLNRLSTEAEPDQGQRGLGVFVSALHAFSDLQLETASY